MANGTDTASLLQLLPSSVAGGCVRQGLARGSHRPSSRGAPDPGAGGLCPASAFDGVPFSSAPRPPASRGAATVIGPEPLLPPRDDVRRRSLAPPASAPSTARSSTNEPRSTATPRSCIQGLSAASGSRPTKGKPKRPTPYPVMRFTTWYMEKPTPRPMILTRGMTSAFDVAQKRPPTKPGSNSDTLDTVPYVTRLRTSTQSRLPSSTPLHKKNWKTDPSCVSCFLTGTYCTPKSSAAPPAAP
mmetsp:Transcript_118660/g.369680  ORF Transcript_118660/g.369680 Transcript_118660/m.369680 type:complete len:243 (+) Transcript_118660:503-1231(+)